MECLRELSLQGLSERISLWLHYPEKNLLLRCLHSSYAAGFARTGKLGVAGPVSSSTVAGVVCPWLRPQSGAKLNESLLNSTLFFSVQFFPVGWMSPSLYTFFLSTSQDHVNSQHPHMAQFSIGSVTNTLGMEFYCP